jgi:hypothetical protein
LAASPEPAKSWRTPSPAPTRAATFRWISSALDTIKEPNFTHFKGKIKKENPKNFAFLIFYF